MRRPRCKSHASNGPNTAPRYPRSRFAFSQSASGSRATSAPANTSPCPLSCLVAECITQSAPSSSGRHSAGVATVPSQTSLAPARCATSAAAAMSVTSQVGLAGVSTQTRRVAPGRTRAASASMSPLGAQSTSTPRRRPNSRSHRRSVQYIFSGATTWSPRSSISKTLLPAAIPEPKSSASAPPSSRASNASTRS